MTVIEENLTAKGFTPAAHVPLVYGQKRVITAITIHWWGSFGQTHDGVNNFFVNGPGSTSCHFVASGIPRPRITCLVSPEDAAWHAGNAVGNATTVGIECRPEATEADYKVVAETVRFLRDTYGANLPLIPHRNWQATQCPGHWDLGKIHRMAEALKVKPAGTVTPAPKPIAPKPDTGEIVNIEYYRDYPGIDKNVNLAAGKSWTLKQKDMKVNWNVAFKGLGYYDVDLFIQGNKLPEGESVTVQAYVVTNGKRSGYFTQDVEGSVGLDGKWYGNIRVKSPLLATARLEFDVTASANCVLDYWGADVYVFKK